jgi:hypothetical protein
MKMNRTFNEFTDFESLDLEVPTFCFVTGMRFGTQGQTLIRESFKETKGSGKTPWLYSW